jgi:hypothetical protein
MLLVYFQLTHAFDGPLQARNQFPLFIYIDAPYLEKASPENSFSATFSYSSVYLVQESSEWSAGLDMEIAELNLRFRKSFGNFIEIGIDLPIVSLTSGFMDGLLGSYHDSFGFPDYGRSERSDNKFLYELRKNRKLIIGGENGHIGLGDTNLSVKVPVLKGDPMISMRGDIEFPTGDAESGFGNDSLDAGISLLIDKKLSESVNTCVNLGAVSPGDFKGYDKIGLKDFLYGGASLEAMVWKDVSIIGQVFIQGSPFPKTGIAEVDRTAVLLSLGGRYQAENSSFEFSLTEDPNTAGAPDVTFNVTVKKRF